MIMNTLKQWKKNKKDWNSKKDDATCQRLIELTTVTQTSQLYCIVLSSRFTLFLSSWEDKESVLLKCLYYPSSKTFKNFPDILLVFFYWQSVVLFLFFGMHVRPFKMHKKISFRFEVNIIHRFSLYIFLFFRL